MSNKHAGRHGVVRGINSVLTSSNFNGKFGRMFRTLPAAEFPDEALHALAAPPNMSAEFEPNPTPENADPRDDEENTVISAGYTYLGQFIDHDLPFHPASSLQKANDPDALVDYRTPRFDLDNIYGRGPDDQPYLYDETGRKFLQGRQLTGSDFDPNTRDLQRNSPTTGPKRALIGDPRNDENVIVSQLQGIFLRFHNHVANFMATADFATVQRAVRWHYQWVVLHDFLPTIIGHETLHAIFPHIKKGTNIVADPPDLRCYSWQNEPYMPVEFSVAAYRFGHSMVRPIYRLNQGIPRFTIFSHDPLSSLTGFREFPSNWAIDWRLFFDFGNHPNQFSSHRIQPAYKIDTSLVNPLANLPKSIAAHPGNLALRNLLRGKSMGLPSGQDVSKKMGIPVIPEDKLRVGKANKSDGTPDEHGKIANPLLTEVHPAFAGNAPLWYYILAEAQQQFVTDDTPIHLGPVGGRLVGEVFAGLLLGDKYSFFNQDPLWKPLAAFEKNGKFGITELISQAIQA